MKNRNTMIYEHSTTKERIEIHKITMNLWYRFENGNRINFRKEKLPKEYQLIRRGKNGNESIPPRV
jgi:hypothetical protein